MIKENQKYLNRLQILLDLSLVVVAMAVSYWGRFVILDGSRSLSGEQMQRVVLWTVVLYGVLYSRMGLYQPKRRESLFKECREILQSNILGFRQYSTIQCYGY